eukprot:13541776-Alexandrium_andersonii.AAC.1
MRRDHLAALAGSTSTRTPPSCGEMRRPRIARGTAQTSLRSAMADSPRSARITRATQRAACSA